MDLPGELVKPVVISAWGNMVAETRGLGVPCDWSKGVCRLSEEELIGEVSCGVGEEDLDPKADGDPNSEAEEERGEEGVERGEQRGVEEAGGRWVTPCCGRLMGRVYSPREIARADLTPRGEPNPGGTVVGVRERGEAGEGEEEAAVAECGWALWYWRREAD